MAHAYFYFRNPESAQYEPFYGHAYTERQLAILDESLSVDEVRLNELSTLYKKAFYFGDLENYETAKSLYELKQEPRTSLPSYTIEEAKAILQSLTPWTINW